MGRAFTRAVTWMLKRRNSIELSSRAQRGICCLQFLKGRAFRRAVKNQQSIWALAPEGIRI